ncbi:VOC family protein [Natronogracilivirga saccharolytica]|uniref:VOC family protein n=1 Tax=Natronogracilivirga saccharolytica TaxID=2812953 RepID=UPI001FE69CB0|nr:VOC family protein [Natronogracilivirga saccharolytica]
MNNHFAPRVGGVLSADIAVPKHEREVRFYSRVLSTGEKPLWREDDLMNNLGVSIIGLGMRSEEYMNLPLHWMPHIQVADVSASVQRTLDLGGSELMQHRDDQGKSQWAVLRDPNGAAFGIIPVIPSEAIPASVEASSIDAVTVGRIYWVDLTVSYAINTRNFYRQVIGWSVHEVGMEHGGEHYADYNMLDEHGRPVAGVCHARGVNVGLPPVWLIYLPVGDLEESLRRVADEDGKVLKIMKRDDEEIEYAVIEDPVGACLALCPA